jgi:peptidoglycan/xylan/chitin deacetylase (PgdA/CDA1 family)
MVRALPIIIDRLRNEGYKFVTLPELLHTPPYK